MEGQRSNRTLDIGMLSLDGEGAVEWLVESEFQEGNAVVSPDGRWLAYQSDETGQVEVHVRPFPNIDEGRWQVSTDGGQTPIWGPDGEELFYMGLNNSSTTVMAAVVEAGPSFVSGTPSTIIDGPYLGGNEQLYDVSADGQRLLMIKRTETNDEISVPAEVIIVENWFEELKRLVPTN